LLRKWAKTHLQQCRISKLSGGRVPGTPAYRGGDGGESRGVDREESGGRQGTLGFSPLCVQ